jgi:hypothetical protein
MNVRGAESHSSRARNPPNSTRFTQFSLGYSSEMKFLSVRKCPSKTSRLWDRKTDLSSQTTTRNRLWTAKTTVHHFHSPSSVRHTKALIPRPHVDSLVLPTSARVGNLPSSPSRLAYSSGVCHALCATPSFCQTTRPNTPSDRSESCDDDTHCISLLIPAAQPVPEPAESCLSVF